MKLKPLREYTPLPYRASISLIEFRCVIPHCGGLAIGEFDAEVFVSNTVISLPICMRHAIEYRVQTECPRCESELVDINLKNPDTYKCYKCKWFYRYNKNKPA